MPRAIWSGTISFGLVNIAVRLYPATRKKDVRFRELDRATGRRIHHQRVRFAGGDGAEDSWPAPAEGAGAGRPDYPTPDRVPDREQLPGVAWSSVPPAIPVATNDVVKGYEVAPDQFVMVSADDLVRLQPERTRRIDIEQFVNAAEVDPVFLDTSYHVSPQRDHERAFRLLVAALAAEERVAISWIVLRHKRHLAMLRAHDGLLMLTTMFHQDEVLPATEVGLATGDEPSPRELKMAKLLIESLVGEFQPARYEDDYRRRVLDLIEVRSGAARPSPSAPDRSSGSGVENLMAALEASLKEVRQRSAAATPKRTRARRRRGVA